MIKSFLDKSLEKCWQTGQCGKIRPDLRHRVLIKLESMDAATCPEDLKNPPGNYLHRLKGKYKGCWAISVNGPWRLIFRYEDGDIFDILFEQYH